MSDSDELFRDLAAALTREQVFALFQPQFGMQSGEIVAVEALARWQHPTLGLIPPQVFIPLAEATGLIHDIGRFMLGESLRAMDEWSEAGTRLEVSVNVSPVQLTDATFFDLLADTLQSRSMPARTLTIEITESLPVADLDIVVPQLERLRSLGLGLSLDDYGSGYAGAEQLRCLPITEVKLDRSIIHSDDVRIMLDVESTIVRAHADDLRVVAEGIETAEHMQVARELGCDRAQGFLLARPMHRSAIDELIAA